MNNLLTLAGTFWSKINTDPAFSHFLDAMDLLNAQAALDLKVLLSQIGRDGVGPYHRIQVLPITLSPVDQLGWYIDNELANVPVIVDRLVKPETVLVSGLDFTVKSGKIIFNKRRPKQNILWGINAEFGNKYMVNFYGAMLGLYAPACHEYKELVNCIFDVRLTSTLDRYTLQEHVKKLLAIYYGATLAKKDECVSGIFTDGFGQFLATDTCLYHNTTQSKVRYNVGEQIQKNSILFDVFTLYMDDDRNIITCILHNPNTPIQLRHLDIQQLLSLIMPKEITVSIRHQTVN